MFEETGLADSPRIGRSHGDDNGAVYFAVLDVPLSRNVDDLETKCTEVFVGDARGVDCRFLGRRLDCLLIGRQFWMLFVAFDCLVGQGKVDMLLCDIVGDDGVYGHFTEFGRFCRWARVLDDETVSELRKSFYALLEQCKRNLRKGGVVEDSEDGEEGGEFPGKGCEKTEFGDSEYELYAIMHGAEWNCRKQARQAALVACEDIKVEEVNEEEDMSGGCI